ncbi:MAG: phenylalanine--tRNA ligase subunit alpha [Candidatus Marinimicrobia bacterium]|nr:phenylalanine--tRNA ligase subunit alpha [Candidatus Neomarinimicrobiota bacterium]
MSLLTDIEKVRAEFDDRLQSAPAGDDSFEELRIAFLGRKGKLAGLFSQLGSVKQTERPLTGKQLNELKSYVTERLSEFQSASAEAPEVVADIDVTLPGDPVPHGSIHPVTQIENEVKAIFGRLGFSVFYGPEVETDRYNFEALNFKPDHPARDMQDTFYLGQEQLLRTHTSNNQIHAMEQMDPPLRILMPGRVFRNEAINARSHCQFHQIEGLVVDRNTSMAELKGTLTYFARELYGPDTVTRFRPSYFPFTEPSAEMDVYWGLDTERDYRITKGTGWLEILGCGMVHPNVLEAGGVDPDEFTGYAFGMGIDRMAMLKWDIGDIRYFYEGDLRFLTQF